MKRLFISLIITIVAIATFSATIVNAQTFGATPISDSISTQSTDRRVTVKKNVNSVFKVQATYWVYEPNRVGNLEDIQVGPNFWGMMSNQNFVMDHYTYQILDMGRTIAVTIYGTRTSGLNEFDSSLYVEFSYDS